MLVKDNVWFVLGDCRAFIARREEINPQYVYGEKVYLYSESGRLWHFSRPSFLTHVLCWQVTDNHFALVGTTSAGPRWVAMHGGLRFYFGMFGSRLLF